MHFGFIGRGVERLGLSVEEVAKKRPGIVYLTVRCYGWDGPMEESSRFRNGSAYGVQLHDDEQEGRGSRWPWLLGSKS
jgi:hypothetical protein